MKKILVLFMGVVLVFSACKKDEEESMYKDGKYKAEMAEFSHGWKEYLEITIKDDAITAADFDAVDEEGALKSGLTEYGMPDPPGLPSAWYPILEGQFVAANITADDPTVDGVSGATGTSGNAQAMFELILPAAKEGKTETIIYTPPAE